MKDPVCGMEIEPGKTTLSKSFSGQTFWFCSDICADSFAKNPQQFVQTTVPSAPAFGLVLALLIYGEQLSKPSVLGIAMVLGGVIWASRPKRQNHYAVIS